MQEILSNAPQYLKHIPAVLLALYLVAINIVAVCITIKDKNIAIANGMLEDKNKAQQKKSGKSGSGQSKGGSSKNSKGNNKSAKKQQTVRTIRRVPEKTLLAIAALGGSIAMILTMRSIRHKTKHAKFMVGIPLIIMAQCLLAVALVFFL